MEENPIVRSMLPKGKLPTMAGPEKRKGNSLVTMRSAMATPLKASEYTPPAAFVETMERPSPYSKPKSTVSFSQAESQGSVLDDLWRI